MSQREIDDINAIDLADLVIAFPSIDILGHQFEGAEQHTLEVGVFIIVLYLYQYQLTFEFSASMSTRLYLSYFILLIAFRSQEAAG